jgi:glycosyltransferase involved in cell wall biosynthesis
LFRGYFPKTGIFIIAGAYSKPGKLTFFTFPKKIFISYTTFSADRLSGSIKRLSFGVFPRIIDYYNIFDPERLPQFIKNPSLRIFRTVEVMYASELLKKTVDYPGMVELSPFDLNQFVPANRTSSGEHGEFVIGRLSRDEDEKHHEASLAVYKELAENHDCRIRIMGGICLASKLDSVPSIELLPANSEPAHEFLQSLDCFYYRTSDYFTESFGRVVFEAMACELPVVCHNRGGYVDFIDSGRNGFIFNTEEEALEIMLELKENPSLRSQIGKAARKTVEKMFSPEARKEVIDSILRTVF